MRFFASGPEELPFFHHAFPYHTTFLALSFALLFLIYPSKAMAEAPRIVSSLPPSGYVDPRSDQVPNTGELQGLKDVHVTFSENVSNTTGGILTSANFHARYFRGDIEINASSADVATSQAPLFQLISGNGAGPYLLRFTPRMPLGSWTLIEAINVQNLQGVPLDTQNGGSSLVFGVLPFDISQNGIVTGADVTRWLEIFNNVIPTAPLTREELIDQTRDGVVNGLDVTRSLHLLNGIDTHLLWQNSGLGAAPSNQGQCSSDSVLARLTQVAIPALDPLGVFTSVPVTAEATPNGDTVIGWARSPQPYGVYLSRIGPSGARVGNDIFVNAESARSLKVLDDGYVLLVRRLATGVGSSLDLLKVNFNGTTIFNRHIVGGENQSVVGSTWFDFDAELIKTSNRFVAYFNIYHHFSDGTHQGDQLNYYDLNGNTAFGGWGWGCSHSLDIELANVGDSVGPVCLSDCYPQKAILFNHYTVISSEPSGNCLGGSSAKLGSLIAGPDGYWVTYVTPTSGTNGDVVVQRIMTNGSTSPRIFVTNTPTVAETRPHLTKFGDGFLVGWVVSGTTHYLQRLDAAGTPVGTPEMTPEAYSYANAYFTYPDGDVGWVWTHYTNNTQINLGRFDACQ